MKRRGLLLLLALLLGFTSGGTDNYRSPNPDDIKRKQRLLLVADPDDPRPTGGIRARSENHTIEIPMAVDAMKDVKRGTKNLQDGMVKFTPIYDGTLDEYSEVLSKLREIDSSIEHNKTFIDNTLKNFNMEYTAAFFKKVANNPAMAQGVFNSYNKFVRDMYFSLTRSVSKEERDIAKRVKEQLGKNTLDMAAQNKTIASDSRLMDSNNIKYTGPLRRRLVPEIASVKYASSSNVVRVRKLAIDSMDKIRNRILPDITKQAQIYMDTGGDKLVSREQQIIEKSTNNIRRQLMRISSELQGNEQKFSKKFNSNLTNMGVDLDRGLASVVSNRKSAKSRLEKKVNDGKLVVDQFRNDVLASAGDLGRMVSEGDSSMDTLDKVSKLMVEAIQEDMTTKLGGLTSADSSLGKATTTGGRSNPGFMNFESSIGAAFSDGKSKSTDMVNGMNGRITNALSDADDVAGQLAGQVTWVNEETSEIVNGQLDRGIGILTNDLGDKRKEKIEKISDYSIDIRRQIDDSHADTDEAMTDAISKAEKSTTETQGSVMGKLSELNSRILNSKTAVRESIDSSASVWVQSVTNARAQLGGQSESLVGMDSELRSLQSKDLPQLDKDNENRIGSAFSQLNQLRRYGSSVGDSFESSASGAFSDMLNRASVGGRAGVNSTIGSLSTKDLDGKVQVLRNSSNTYRNSLAQFEADMNDEMKSMNFQYTLIDRNLSTPDRAIGQIVAHQQSDFALVGRDLVRNIYAGANPENSLILKLITSNPRFDVVKYLGNLLHDNSTGSFIARYPILNSELSEMSTRAEKTRLALSSLFQYFESLKGTIVKKYNEIPPNDGKAISDFLNYRNTILDEIVKSRRDLNMTIEEKFRTISDYINNKTSNYYKEFQTASIFADSIVEGFREYVDKMIAFEKITSAQRNSTEEKMIESIEASFGNSSKSLTEAMSRMNASEIERINGLAVLAMNTTDQSADGIRRRQEANRMLIDALGADLAAQMMRRYEGLSGNSDEMAKAIESAKVDLTRDQERELAASRLGVDGINSKSLLFSTMADNEIESQKSRATEIGTKIDELLSNSDFLRNVSSQELGKVLESVQEGDQVRHSKLSAYREESANNIATLGGTVGAFANLVDSQIHKTRDYLDALSANFTRISMTSGSLFNAVLDSAIKNISGISDIADSTNQTLRSDMASILPIQDGLSERLDSLITSENEFAWKTQKEIRELVNRVVGMDNQISIGRVESMQRLRDAMTQLSSGFRDKAMEYQQMKADKSSLIETSSNRIIRQDIAQRINHLQTYAQ